MSQVISIHTNRDKTIAASQFIDVNRKTAFLWSNSTTNYYDVNGLIWYWWHEGTGTYPECAGDIVAQGLKDEIAFEAEIKAYWEAELKKPQRPVYYLPSAQMAPESLCQPLPID